MSSIRPYETKDGEKRYMIDYYVPKDIAGTDKPKKVVKRGFKTLKAAKDALRERQNWLEDGSHDQKIQRKHYTFDMLAKQYREIFESQLSWQGAKQYQVERLANDFEGRLLTSFNYLELQKYRLDLAKTPIRRRMKKGKRETVKNIVYPQMPRSIVICHACAICSAVLWNGICWLLIPLRGKRAYRKGRISESGT